MGYIIILVFISLPKRFVILNDAKYDINDRVAMDKYRPFFS